MIEKDTIQEELERIKGRSTLARFLQEPKEVIMENPIRIGYIAGAIAAVLMVLIYIFDVEFVAPYDAYILAGIVAFIPPAYYIHVEDKRIKKAEETFPELLRELARSKKAGLWGANRNDAEYSQSANLGCFFRPGNGVTGKAIPNTADKTVGKYGYRGV
jgi:Flp pilus assembly protein TadB